MLCKQGLAIFFLLSDKKQAPAGHSVQNPPVASIRNRKTPDSVSSSLGRHHLILFSLLFNTFQMHQPSFNPWHILCLLFQGICTCPSFSLEGSSPRPPRLVLSHHSDSRGASLSIFHPLPTAHPLQGLIKYGPRVQSVHSHLFTCCLWLPLCGTCRAGSCMCSVASETTRSLRLKLFSVWRLSGRVCPSLPFLQPPLSAGPISI